MSDNRNDDMDFREVTDDESVDIKDKKENDNPNISSARREDVPEFEDVCFVCRRPESKAGKMFRLPNNICI